MKLLDILEKKFGKFAIRNFMLYIIGTNVFVFLLQMFYPIAYDLFSLNPYRILEGEVWRLLTFIFIPPTSSLLFLFFVLYFYYMIGNTLEREWGSFKFNVYYLIGVIGTIVSAFITGQIMYGSIYLNLSLFLAFARLYPEFRVLIFFIIPVKMKWIAWLNWGFFAFTIIFNGWAVKIAAIVALINYFIFFGKDILTNRKRSANAYYRKKQYQSKMNVKSTTTNKESYHKCTVCGKTEQDDETLEFRICSKCDGHYEYCMDHLKNHEHIV